MFVLSWLVFNSLFSMHFGAGSRGQENFQSPYYEATQDRSSFYSRRPSLQDKERLYEQLWPFQGQPVYSDQLPPSYNVPFDDLPPLKPLIYEQPRTLDAQPRTLDNQPRTLEEQQLFIDAVPPSFNKESRNSDKGPRTLDPQQVSSNSRLPPFNEESQNSDKRRRTLDPQQVSSNSRLPPFNEESLELDKRPRTLDLQQVSSNSRLPSFNEESRELDKRPRTLDLQQVSSNSRLPFNEESQDSDKRPRTLDPQQVSFDARPLSHHIYGQRWPPRPSLDILPPHFISQQTPPATQNFLNYQSRKGVDAPRRGLEFDIAIRPYFIVPQYVPKEAPQGTQSESKSGNLDKASTHYHHASNTGPAFATPRRYRKPNTRSVGEITVNIRIEDVNQIWGYAEDILQPPPVGTERDECIGRPQSTTESSTGDHLTMTELTPANLLVTNTESSTPFNCTHLMMTESNEEDYSTYGLDKFDEFLARKLCENHNQNKYQSEHTPSTADDEFYSSLFTVPENIEQSYDDDGDEISFPSKIQVDERIAIPSSSRAPKTSKGSDQEIILFRDR